MAEVVPVKRILVIHGPNLNMLGKREPEVYGSTSLATIDGELQRLGKQLHLEVATFQSNHEGELVDRIQQAISHVDGVIINPAAYTHTSVALRDALLLLECPVIEVHLSNIHRRESFRQRSLVADVVHGSIAGLGVQGYPLALRALAELIDPIA